MISESKAPPKRPPLLEILKFGHPILETPCNKVQLSERPEAEHLADEMLAAMYAAGGWGLSASQVGKSWRMFVMHCHHGETVQDPRTRIQMPKCTPYIMVNPVIRDTSEETVILKEGCLSFPGVRQYIERPRHVLVAWHDVHDWSVKAAQFSDWEARCIQHEIDHFDGRLLLHHMLPAAQKKLRKRAAKGLRL